ncbi:MAG TPA: phage holin family protein [Bryobacteraceae bacterium]|nr:phage holin family protein [Bryobacteraceae bacterium]
MEDTGRQAGGQFGMYSHEGGEDMVRERSFGELVKSIIGNLQEIVRSEVRLARVEVKEEATRAISAGRDLGIAAGVGLFAVLFLLNALMFGLANWMPMWAAAGIIGVLLAIVAGALYSKGKGEWKEFTPKPEKTLETVKENVEWIKTQTKS